jgi:hypothetical protein
MIRPLVAMPTPPPAPAKNPPQQDAPSSFRDWVAAQDATPKEPTGPLQQNVGLDSSQQAGAPPKPVSGSSLTATPRPTIDSLQGTMPSIAATGTTGLALRIVHRTGAVELVAMPWRLVATGGLAHLLGLRGSVTSGGCTGTRAAPLGGMSAISGYGAVGQRLAESQAGSGADSEISAVALASDPSVSLEQFDVGEYADAHERAHAPTALPWVARLLRWVDDHGGEATLWVRDFRLDDGDKRALVATLREAAVQSGFRLHRIVINGRAHWHVHRPVRENPHAG